MSATTSTAYYTGNTLVRVKMNGHDEITVPFATRHDAAVFLNSPRKRVR